MLRYIRKDGTLRFGDFVAIILNLSIAFGNFIWCSKFRNCAHLSPFKLSAINILILILDAFDKRDPLQTGTIRINRAEVRGLTKSIIPFHNLTRNFMNLSSGFEWLSHAKERSNLHLLIHTERIRKSPFFIAFPWFHIFITPKHQASFYLWVKLFDLVWPFS